MRGASVCDERKLLACVIEEGRSQQEVMLERKMRRERERTLRIQSHSIACIMDIKLVYPALTFDIESCMPTDVFEFLVRLSRREEHISQRRVARRRSPYEGTWPHIFSV